MCIEPRVFLRAWFQGCGSVWVFLQNYYEKLEKRQEKERDSSSKKEHATKLITPQIAKVEHTYRPGNSQQNPPAAPEILPDVLTDVCRLSTVQFAGSLGKLTVSSVNNPRKMIDAVVTTRSDDEVRLRLFPAVCLRVLLHGPKNRTRQWVVLIQCL